MPRRRSRVRIPSLAHNMKVVIKTFILAFGFSLLVCLMVGLFNHSPIKVEEYGPWKWLYVNRGYPEPWAGITLSRLNIDFPMVRMPFLINMELKTDSQGVVMLDKIVNIFIVGPIFLKLLVVGGVGGYFLSRIIKSNKIYWVLLLLVSGLNVWIYLDWFSRI